MTGNSRQQHPPSTRTGCYRCRQSAGSSGSNDTDTRIGTSGQPRGKYQRPRPHPYPSPALPTSCSITVTSYIGSGLSDATIKLLLFRSETRPDKVLEVLNRKPGAYGFKACGFPLS